MPAIQRSANSELTALGTREESKRIDASLRFPSLKLHRGYGELLSDPEIDAVYLPLPNALHFEWAIKAAERGKHVLCEKPLALNAEEVRGMIEAAEANHVLLMEAFMYRYTARTRQVCELVCSGALGEIKFVHASFRFLLTNPASIKLKPELGGGALYDVGCYPVNFIGMIADLAGGTVGAARPLSIAVECVRMGGIDQLFSALLKYPSGLIGSLHCGFNAHKRIAAEIVGTKAVLEIPDTFLDEAGALVLTSGEDRRELPVPASDRYCLEIEDFAEAILTNRAPKLSLAESLRNAEVIDRLLVASWRED